MATALHVDACYAEGRGPELRAIHWSHQGRHLEAIDYQNPDEVNVRHLRFTRPQVYMRVPEEVINPLPPDDALFDGRVAILDLGHTQWLAGFAPSHLKQCRHFRLLFYDELIDVICEGISAHEGAWRDPHVGA